ncbi:hypothetical protein GGR56DRAFT_668651 [Xylariaceae sp. FL0804]|nr:hypothetical protein GGR56DRAFT_668651 [Xylariaceae sp. FL0804]
MDRTASQKPSRERSLARDSSRASTARTHHSQTHTHTPPRSTTSSSSHLRDIAHATPPQSSHPPHKYHHSSCGRSPADQKRPSPRLSREPSRESKASMPPVSSFLQERLQLERRAESERLATSRSGDLGSPTSDSGNRGAQLSPSRGVAASTPVRLVSKSSDEASSQAGMGLVQMEKTVETLHKQNFHLKLEVQFRRERQSVLEKRVEKLEAEGHEMNDIQVELVTELEKRDKAIEEAVAMIVQLEERVNQLVLEKEMVRRVEDDGTYRHTQSISASVATNETPRRGSLEYLPQLGHGANTLERMPSFLSEHSEFTENLRNVVLQNRSSLHFRKMSGISLDPGEINRLASPSLSLLSESSFTSIYGSKEGQDHTGVPPGECTSGMDGSQADRAQTPTGKTRTESWGSHGKTRPSPATTAAHRPTAQASRMSSLNDMLQKGGSPLQKLERLDRVAPNVDEGSRPSTSGQGTGGGAGARVRSSKSSSKSSSQARDRQGKRPAPQKLTTGYPTHKELASSHTLPPTPDTVSSAVLHKYQPLTSSQDSLINRNEATSAEGLVPPLSEKSGHTVSSGGSKPPSDPNSQPASTTAFSSRRNVPQPAINADMFALPPRPHSATETTFSRPRADSFVTDSDDSDGGADAKSGTENLDPWMQESLRQTHRQTERSDDRSPSPDLFSFPAGGKGWETDAMFGVLRGNGFFGSPVAGLKRDPIDEMTSSLEAPQTETLTASAVGPDAPPPSRRSSLLANALGSNHAAPRRGGKIRKNPSRGASLTRGRSNSFDSSGGPPRQQQLQNQQLEQQPQQPGVAAAAPESKRSQYPPISRLHTRGRSLGLNTLFRRAGSGSDNNSSSSSRGGSGGLVAPHSAVEPTFPSSCSPGAAATTPTPTQSQFAPLPRLSASLARPTPAGGRNSVPPPPAAPWGPPPPGAAAMEELDPLGLSATPPPIMRKRAPSAAMAMPVDPSGASNADWAGAAPSRPATAMGGGGSGRPTTAAPGAGAADGADGGGETLQGAAGKRKWLGFGRKGSVKNRTG